MAKKKSKKVPRLSPEIRQAMLRNAAGTHGDKRKQDNKRKARSKVCLDREGW